MNIDLLAKRKYLAKAALQYAELAYLDHEVAKELDERLNLIKLQPEVILNLGAKDGYSAVLLQHRYSQASIFSMELHEAFFALTPGQKALVAEAEFMPLKNNSVDMIFSNLVLHSVNDFQKTILEFRRILKPNGLLFFSMLGRDTLKELRESFYSVSSYPHIHDFFDMHDVGDALLKHHFSDPVMDAEQITIQFSSPMDLIREIKKSGQSNAHLDRKSGLMGKKAWEQMIKNYESFAEENIYPATFEIIYGHAFTPSLEKGVAQNEDGEILFPANLIKLKK